jgi:RNA polymerase sigma-70 factor (ECF subfamily)
MPDTRMGEEMPRLLAGLVPRLRRFGLALTGSRADADDLVQMACERALQRGEQLRDHARIDGWLYGIMRHLWIDEIRSRRVRRHADLDEAGEVEGASGTAAEGVVMLGTVRQCLQALSADHRTVLILVCVDGLTYREAAEVLGVPIGTVMSRIARARQELHARLAAGRGGNDTNVMPLVPARGRNGAARGAG